MSKELTYPQLVWLVKLARSPVGGSGVSGYATLSETILDPIAALIEIGLAELHSFDHPGWQEMRLTSRGLEVLYSYPVKDVAVALLAEGCFLEVTDFIVKLSIEDLNVFLAHSDTSVREAARKRMGVLKQAMLPDLGGFGKDVRG